MMAAARREIDDRLGLPQLPLRAYPMLVPSNSHLTSFLGQEQSDEARQRSRMLGALSLEAPRRSQWSDIEGLHYVQLLEFGRHLEDELDDGDDDDSQEPSFASDSTDDDPLWDDLEGRAASEAASEASSISWDDDFKVMSEKVEDCLAEGHLALPAESADLPETAGTSANWRSEPGQ
ncbi:unnamed protein product [Symbiodinium necroappetens]|uniref:Uncharacterized protein n=1 Tax=Symbiodinium necroappetens TaxID=1628268 RepID=A0A813BSA6_9DINO|nr:unnamed protein product [Symbiodinium necroappetens]|mmetsp:Transcript_126566/g.300616  ORF Transcript_126566/g.300616 Transcript_126566/m.300616 type:complete len:177 (+) Transcript_126566:52-582(+)